VDLILIYHRTWLLQFLNMMPFTIPQSSSMQGFPSPISPDIESTSTRSQTSGNGDYDNPHTIPPPVPNETLQEYPAGLPMQSSQQIAPASPRIPIPSLSEDYQQEKQFLHDQEQLADYRDYVFFHRVVHGIRQAQRKSQDAASLLLYCQNEQCLSHVIMMRQLDNPQAPPRVDHLDVVGRLSPSLNGNQEFTAPRSLVSQAGPSHWDVSSC
jgi:hypothetical protein